MPAGWKVKVARAYSHYHACILWTVWVDGPDGLSDWFTATDATTMKDKALAMIEELTQ